MESDLKAWEWDNGEQLLNVGRHGVKLVRRSRVVVPMEEEIICILLSPYSVNVIADDRIKSVHNNRKMSLVLDME